MKRISTSFLLGGGLILLVIVALFVGFKGKKSFLGIFRREPPPETVAAITAKCYEPKRAEIDTLRAEAPPTALESIDFRQLQGLHPLLRQFAARSNYATEQASAEELVPTIRSYYTRLAEFAVDVVTCYEAELKKYPAFRRAATAAVSEARARLAEAQTFDVSLLLVRNAPAEPVLRLAPQETKRVRLRTFCIDSLAEPPKAGSVYLLGGSVEELKKNDYCRLLRQGQAGADLGTVQGTLWSLEPKDVDGSPQPVAPVPGSEGLPTAQSSGAIRVTAVSSGTLTDLDVTVTNTTDRELSLDTSCAYFVPLSMPKAEPLPERPAIDLTKPEDAQRYIQRIQELQEEFGTVTSAEEAKAYAERLKQLQEELQSGAPQVKGVFSGLRLPVDLRGIDVGKLPPFHPAQIGLGRQPLGSSGVTGKGAPKAPRVPRLEEILAGPSAKEQARRRLDHAWREYQANRTLITLEEMVAATETCWVVGCAPTSEIERYRDLLRGDMEEVLRRTVDNVERTVNQDTLQSAVAALRLCAALGCDSGPALAEVDRLLREDLRRLQQQQAGGNPYGY